MPLLPYCSAALAALMGLAPAAHADVFGHVRARATMQQNALWGTEHEGADWYVTHRYHLGAEHSGTTWRAGFELAAAYDHGAAFGTSPVDENRLDLHRAWLDLSLSDSVSLRLGRDEWKLGSGRLVATRDGTNVKRRFDGAVLKFSAPGITIKTLAGFEVENDPGVFDDGIGKGKALWGTYATIAVAPGTGIDVYYLGYRAGSARDVRGASEVRHSIGARLFGDTGIWDWDGEAAYQFGHQGTATIAAWTIAATAGRTFRDTMFSPRFALSANIASGDRDGTDNKLTAFNALFPRGSYFSDLAHLGPRNFYNLNPYLTLELAERLTVTMDVNMFWRFSRADGVYAPNGSQILAADPNAPRYVDTATSVNFEFTTKSGIFLGAIATRSAPGAFVRHVSPDARAITFIELTARLDF